TSVNLTYKPTSLGNHTVTAVIDSDGDILETNESNNNLSSVINVTLTDLVPIRILPDIVYLNKTNRMTIPVTGTAEGFNATLIAYARDMPNGTITVWDETGNATNLTNPTIINATDLDTYNNGNLTIWWQPDFSGWYNLTVIVDPDNDVNETNESNNNLAGEAFVANEIQLELVVPRGGEVCGGIHPIKWKALHDKNLTIDLFYSSNYGIEWTVLASNLTCDPSLTANLTENLIRGGNVTNTTDTTNTTDATNTSNTTNLTHAVNYNGVYLWDTTNHSDGEYLIRITARWYILMEVYTSNTVIVLNGDAASGGIGGNARYFDWDTPDEPHLAWVSEDIFAGGATSIVVADDTVFVYCTGSEGFSSSDYTYMVALNATNGEMLWATEIAPAEYGSWASPAYHNGSIFIASGMHVYRIAGDTGAIVWDYPFSDCCANCNGGPSISGGRVYVTSFYRSTHPDPSMTCPESGEGNLFCLDVKTGGELWNTSTYLPPISHLGTPTTKYGRIYYGRGASIYCLTMDDGEIVWNTSLKHDAFSTPVVVDGVVYISTYEFGMGFGGFNCLDAFNGSILWNYPVQRTDSTPAHFAPRGSDKKYIYIVGGCEGFSESGVYCFNATNGSLIWGSEEVGSWTNSPAVSRDAKVFAGVDAGSFKYNGLKCLDAYTGDPLWSSPYGGSSPYIAYGRIYTIGGNRLYAFGRRDLPDLVVTAASASRRTVHATIRNNGTGGTNESFKVALTKGGRVIGEYTVDALDAGESTSVSLSACGACGYLMVKADSGGDIPERDEYNNMRGVTVVCDSGGHGEYGTKGYEGGGDGGEDTSSDKSRVRQGIGPRGSGYLGKYFDFGDGTDEDATDAGIEAVINETESIGTEQKAKGYPMGTEFKTGGAGGGYVSYTMAILAILILLGLLVQGMQKERGRYRRYMK
ncbi:MAG: PQQ-binding-like beta-propeller repeat protein, partial [Methanosarcinales archaeon]|nr:PQQ-binding-like beta-propeller repeat protein [Methanosarcinales archaeon]